jgi:hypothetical protein
MSQMRAGDLHAGAQSSLRARAASTATDEDVGNATQDVGDADQALQGVEPTAPASGS